MPIPVPTLLPGEMFFDYTVNILWMGTAANGNQQIPPLSETRPTPFQTHKETQ